MNVGAWGKEGKGAGENGLGVECLQTERKEGSQHPGAATA